MDVIQAIKVLKDAGAVFCLPPESKRSLTLDEVEERLRFGRTWIIKNLAEFPGVWRAKGGGRNGGELRIPERDVDAYVKRQRIHADLALKS
jgi:hypothetical protein